MVENSIRKNILVLSDSDLLFDVIKVNLEKIPIEIDLFRRDDGNQVPDVDFDLIVVVSSSPSSEPIVALHNASLTDRIGRTSIMIISDREFDPDQTGHIFHLDFPINSSELRAQVQALLV
ncbi:MAG: hypothetical protein GY832_03080 [Chloroflexi bacterium]|nr:hypothetical protein [Chloroflexota bacterium]